MAGELALLGGPKAVRDPLPHWLESAGRTFGPEEERLVLEALRSGCLSRNGGTMVKRFEAEFGARLGVPHSVACSSGTASVHLCVAALDPEPGDEFITTPITDMGTLMPILWQNCVPVFADVDPRTLTLDPEDVARKITPRTRAIIAVHLAGQPCDLGALRCLANEHGLVLIEDCSQAYWAEYDGKLVGTIGDLACFSLQQTKHMTCGEGGIMVTRNQDWANRALLFSDKAWPRDSASLGAWRFLFLSQNYRMSELQGAVALAQLGKVAEVVRRRRERAEQLTGLIEGVAGVRAPFVPENTRHSYWLYFLQVEEGTREFGDALLAEGVRAWVQYIVDPLYRSPVFAQAKTYGASRYPFSAFDSQRFEEGLCPNAEAALRRLIAIHWNENYTGAQVDQIGEAIRKVAAHYAR